MSVAIVGHGTRVQIMGPDGEYHDVEDWSGWRDRLIADMVIVGADPVDADGTELTMEALHEAFDRLMRDPWTGDDIYAGSLQPQSIGDHIIERAINDAFDGIYETVFLGDGEPSPVHRSGGARARRRWRRSRASGRR